jgi:hypothetical protein
MHTPESWKFAMIEPPTQSGAYEVRLPDIHAGARVVLMEFNASERLWKSGLAAPKEWAHLPSLAQWRPSESLKGNSVSSSPEL